MYLYLIQIRQERGNVVESSVRNLICGRKSVRTYNGVPLLEEDIRKLEKYMKTLDSPLENPAENPAKNSVENPAKNPFGVSVVFRILNAKKEGLSSPVVLGTDTYVGAKVPRMPNSEIAFGYDFERFVLYAHSLGIGTVWLAATIDRPAFEKAMEVEENEVMPAVTPIGYSAAKRSVRETLMRKALKADERLSFESLFFKESFSTPLTQSDAGTFKEALEMVRLAPSAGNKQPWRAVVCGDTVHFYEKKAKSLSQNPLGDIQKVDIGIALLHFVLMIEEAGMDGSFLMNDPDLTQEADTEYIISYQVGK